MSHAECPEDQVFLSRCPSESFETPEAGKKVPIRPLKRNLEVEEDEASSGSPSPTSKRGQLSPQRLDMDQEAKVVFGCTGSQSSEEEEERVVPTQVYVPEEEPTAPSLEEGEIPAEVASK